MEPNSKKSKTKNDKKTSNKAKRLCELGARPQEDWTRYTILREVKRCLPEYFGQAKSMPLEILYNSISPIVEATTTWVYCTQYAYSFESVASGCLFVRIGCVRMPPGALSLFAMLLSGGLHEAPGLSSTMAARP